MDFRNIARVTYETLRQYTSPQIISLDLISFGFLAYIDAVCRL